MRDFRPVALAKAAADRRTSGPSVPEDGLIPNALETDTRTEAAPSCRRRPASTTLRLAQTKVVDTGLRRYDGVGVVRGSPLTAAGMSAMEALAKAAEISGPGVAPRSLLAAAVVRPVDRIDLSALTTAPPLHQPSVSGAASGRAGDHVGGAMLPPPVNMVALSDGTRISFGAVEEVPVNEYV